MRITGGLYRGRILGSPKDRAVRPTSDKVRAAVFNILNARGLVRGAAVLDAFCGTGALGLEALSWGASSCVFMDKSRASLELCRQNHAVLKVEAPCFFALKDAAKPGSLPETAPPADLVFLDPPYELGLVEAALPALHQGGWIAQEAHILVESEKSFSPAKLHASGYGVLLERDYGDTRIFLLGRTGEMNERAE
ncbi:MAG: 16S rRNA (guanine(966)-N(2))-methyltransferase RsmD [Micavibrio sp.]